MRRYYLEFQKDLAERPLPRNYRWYVLGLIVLTNMVVAAIPSMSMSVMSQEISLDLNLTVVQVGIVWGVAALPGIITSLLGGALGDQIGPKNVIIMGTFLSGLLGASRGLVGNFTSMTVVVLILGALIPFVSMNGFKTSGMWFPSKELGLANGLISMGMALGFLIGSLTSATFLSPLLGGWRNVFIFYGLFGALLSVLWVFTRPAPVDKVEENQEDIPQISMRQAIGHVIRSKNIWLLGLALLGVSGCIQAMLGYLPLYLRTIGWAPLQADGVLSSFHMISMIMVLPITFLADRTGARKLMILASSVLITGGIFLLGTGNAALVWPAALMAGVTRDGFMALLLTMTVETEDIGPLYAGTATGLVMSFGGLGTFLAPPIGNSLAEMTPNAPFLLWAALAGFGLVCLLFVKNTAPELKANAVELAVAD